MGIVNGYIEEMMEGQKVVKVFCHEDKSLEPVPEAINQELRESSNQAPIPYANIMMPVNANLGNISYVLCAVSRSMYWRLSGHYQSDAWARWFPFLNLNKNFTSADDPAQPADEQYYYGNCRRRTCFRTFR